MNERETDFLTFQIENHSFAIPVQDIEKVERAVEITDVPGSGALLHGVVDYHGTLLPVINLRQKFALAPKEITPEQKLLIVNTHLRQIAILVDEVGEVTTIPEKETYEANALTSKTNSKTEKRTLLFNKQNEIVILYEMEGLLAGELDKEIKQLRELLFEKE